MPLFAPKIEAKWVEPVAFRRARADYERGRPIDLRKRMVIVFGAMGAVAGIGFHSLNELFKHPEFAAALAVIALLVGIFYMPLRGYLLEHTDAKIQLTKKQIERRAALGLERDKWEIKDIRHFEFSTANGCDLLQIEMEDGTRAYFGIPPSARANIKNNLRSAVKASRPERFIPSEP